MSAFCRFIDSFGFEWQAYEVLIPKSAQRAAHSVLYFFSRGATRALDAFPSEWETLSWADLEDLCAQGRAVYRDGLVDVHPGFHPRAQGLAVVVDTQDGASTAHR